ncbi:FadR family transcriptional regulator [Aestuariicella hydrocarbonica]|uniref:FadR family transcriptional regulator n=1 Tax=Pseudomaricurvus hydrocarbonicus TaxID=1470433 RepID=A0A9E5T2A6_9GAMM|nr:FadR/GntR family transcriptional regulator [Aestuariicella hydrocarbonica]NHO68265.1 FadR family transcriptional regulator [Aestuariicella hydrocarbonica]
MQIQAIKVRRLYLEIANQIESLISSGQLVSGERLPSERDLAQRFEVSRPTIREAMIALEIAGLVEIRTGSGIYVKDQAVDKPGLRDDGPGPFEILEARRLLESEIVTLAAARITPAQMDELEQALEVMEQEDQKGTISEEADQRFHCILAEASHNSALASMVSWLWELRNRSEISALFHERVREEGVHPSAKEHRAIFEALRNRDPLAAQQAMRSHISQAITADRELLDKK